MSEKEQKFEPSANLCDRDRTWAVRLHEAIGKELVLYLRSNPMSIKTQIIQVSTDGLVNFYSDGMAQFQYCEVHVADIVMINYY